MLHERVLLLSRLGDHTAALRVLALWLRDIDGCLRYCRRQQRQQQRRQQQPHDGQSAGALASCGDAWRALLALLLSPGDGHAPMFNSAVRVLHEEGGSLDPRDVLAALPARMALAEASHVLRSLLRGVSHRRRQTAVLKGLHRATNLGARAALAGARSGRAVVDADTRCAACRRMLGDKVVYAGPGGALLCARCAEPHVGAAHGDSGGSASAGGNGTAAAGVADGGAGGGPADASVAPDDYVLL
eukprot:352544-Chlamydomonas_euryale.AAC.26